MNIKNILLLVLAILVCGMFFACDGSTPADIEQPGGSSDTEAKGAADTENTEPEEDNMLPATDAVIHTLLGIKDWQGATGPISIDEHGIIQSLAEEKIIIDGKPVLLEE